jgi:hypothetical protein
MTAMAKPEIFPSAADAGLTLEQSHPESLLERLALALESSGIAYCQWRGHWSSHRWATGHGDVDLLVSREYLARFRALVGELGFKPTLPQGERQLPAIEHYFGYDPATPRLLHLHVHYQLMLGDYWKPVYRIPLERELLEGSLAGRPFRVPGPTLQFLVFVLRLMLRQVGRPILSLHNRWISGVQIQLESLESCSDRQELAALLRKLNLERSLFDRCVRSLRGEAGRWERAVLPWLLHRRLRAHARRPSVVALGAAAIEKLFPAYASRRSAPGLSGGGTVVALVGGDGAGKSTCAHELRRWLSPALRTTHAHLGNPPKSLLTLVAGAALKLEQTARRLLQRPHQGTGLLELLRHLCTARDRYRLYVRVQQFAAAGGIAICERYPVEENYPLAGPVIPQLLSGRVGPVADLLRRREAAYYARIQRPDVLCVLRLDPEIAVLRKFDEPAEYVRARGRMVWETDWTSTGARMVEADRPLPEVLERLKAIIWSVL